MNQKTAYWAREPFHAPSKWEEALHWLIPLKNLLMYKVGVQQQSCVLDPASFYLVNIVMADTEERQKNTQEKSTEAYRNRSQGRKTPLS